MSEQAEKYQRKHDFAPYTKADGNAVAEEFDAIQAHLDKVPALRNDGKGFTVSPVIPEPTEDNHPVTYGQLKNAENSVQKNKEVVTQKAQEVAQNASQTALDRETAEQAKELAQTAAQTATTQADIATQKADIATQKADSITESATLAEQSKQSAVSSENNARKWAVNPEDEQVQNGEFSAYHHAVKARKSKESAEQSASSANSAKETALASAQTATQKASEVETALSQINQTKTTVEQKTNEALSHAAQAQSSAQTATEKANLIIGEADRAEEYSNNAQTASQSAQSYASSANESANRAEKAAELADRTLVENNLTSTSTNKALSAAMGKKLQDEKFNRNEKLPWASISAKPTGLEGYGRTFNGVFTLDHTQPIMIFRRSGNNLFYFGTPSADSTDVYIHSYVHGTNLRFKQDGVYFNREIFANSYQKVIHEGNFQVKQVANNTSANMLRTDGHYYLPNSQNLPDAGTWHLEVISGGAKNAVRQIARKVGESDVRERHYNGSVWSSWKKSSDDGMPLGSIVAFPKHITPHGYLKAIGGTFNQETYPDLYIANGNSNILPNLNRSDVGMTAYFPFDDIPEGWIAFDSIRSTVTQQSYPELYQYLVAKYGSISQVPLADDRFIRNVNNRLRVGQTQESSFEHHHGIGRIIANNDAGLIIGEWQDQNHKSIIVHGQEAYIDIRNVNGDAESGGSRPLRTAKENAQGEVRPKSIALKLCIKAKNTFDDVQFWIKAFGTIENAGVLDAGTLAQNLQQTNQKIQDVENTLNQNQQQINQVQHRIEQLSSLNSTSTRKIWQGNVASESSILSLSESIANKNIILYLQPSSSHSLNNNDVITISFFVDQKLSEARHKRFLNTAFYDSAWRSLKVEVVNDRQIKLVESSGFFLKAITVS